MTRFLWLALVIVLPACIGPIDYINTVARKARRALAQAEAVDAQKLSPYEYWSAVTYLHMAREKGARADYQDANKYGSKATEMAERAMRIASEKASKGPVEPEGSTQERK